MTGVGLTFKCFGGTWVVSGVKQGYEQALSGIVNVGDAILAVDGVPTAGMSIHDLGRAVIGEEGTTCVLTLAVRGGARNQASLRRTRVTLV
jgi:C-terminal processing protease CtpA/Prc